MTVINVTRRPHQIRQDNAPDDDRENNQSSAIAVNDNMDMRQQNRLTAPDPVQRVRAIAAVTDKWHYPVLFFLITASEKFPHYCVTIYFAPFMKSVIPPAICVHTPVSPSDRARRHAPGPLPPSPALLFRRIPAPDTGGYRPAPRRSAVSAVIAVSPIRKVWLRQYFIACLRLAASISLPLRRSVTAMALSMPV